MHKLGTEIYYDYRDDPTTNDQLKDVGVLPFSPIRFSDENFNATWLMYRPPHGVSMDDQLDKWYKTPMTDRSGDKADGIFKFGIPRNVLGPLSEFWLQHPLLKPLRKEYENCKIMKQNPALCITEGVKYAQTMNKLAEQPFTKCPKQTVGWVKCLDDNAKNYNFCRDLEVEWNSCMKTHFDIHIPPFPLHPRREEWNAGETDKYRMRVKSSGRDAYSDFLRHIGVGLIHPETDVYSDNY